MPTSTRLSMLPRWLMSLAAGVLAWGTAPTHAADDYPTKPVTIVVAYAPGGQGDVFARLVGEKLSTI